MIGFECLDCGVDTSAQDGIAEYYMVTPQLWNACVPEYHGMLCIGCLEGRLGRQLRPADFITCPINTVPNPFNPHSERLLDRLTGGTTCPEGARA